MRILVVGATGFIGKVLMRYIDEPVVLTRNREAARAKFPKAGVFEWNPDKGVIPEEAFEGVEAVFNLAGENISVRWTEISKRRIRESRISATRTIVSAIEKCGKPPKVLINASAIGYYGSAGEGELSEESDKGTGFLSDICGEWETEAMKAEALGVRVVTPRFGIVLGRSGGLLRKLLLPFKFGLGGRLGDGKQWMSWISVFDLAGILMFALETEKLRGPVNAVSPRPVRNSDFTEALADTLERPAVNVEFSVKNDFGGEKRLERFR